MSATRTFTGSLSEFEKRQVRVRPPVRDSCYIGIDRQLAIREAQNQAIIEGTFLRGGFGQPDSSQVIRREIAARLAPFRMSDALFQGYLRERAASR